MTVRQGDGLLAGIGATILAGTMGVLRWRDFGGDRTAETIGPSASAAVDSLKRLSPSLPSIALRRPSDGEPGDSNDLDGSPDLAQSLPTESDSYEIQKNDVMDAKEDNPNRGS